MDLFKDYIPRAVEAAQKVFTRPCWQCEQAADLQPSCPECRGSGENVPAPDSLEVCSYILSDIFSAVVQARDAEKFGLMNDLLDVGDRFLAGLREDFIEKDPEKAADLLKKNLEVAAEVLSQPKKRNNITLSGGALSLEELQELGIEPEKAKDDHEL